MAKKPRPLYGGEASKPFWKLINATGDLTLYNFACALQDIEARVLMMLYRKATEGRARPVGARRMPSISNRLRQTQ